MDQSLDVSLLRNVQAADGKSSVSKEFVGTRKKRERNRAKREAASGAPAQKPTKGYGNDTPKNPEEREHIDITI